MSIYRNYTFLDGKIKERLSHKTKKQVFKDESLQKKQKGYVDESNVVKLKDGGFLVHHWKKYSSYLDSITISRFDKDQELLWKRLIGTGTKKLYFTSELIFYEDDFCFLRKYTLEKGEYIHDEIIPISMKDGFTKSNETTPKGAYSLTLPNDFNRISHIKNYDDKVIILGQRINSYGVCLGFFRTVFHKRTMSLEWRFLYFRKLSKLFPQITKSGELEKGYKLHLRDAFINADGSMYLLTEKFKSKKSTFLMTDKTLDFVVISLDDKFKPASSHQISKSKETGSFTDYLFGQELNKKGDFAFFHKNFKKSKDTNEKNWILGINTIVNSEVTTVEIPLNPDKNSLSPYPAKQGYIGLREFNEKGNFNQLRLEKLNY